jgi:hypothetical protein
MAHEHAHGHGIVPHPAVEGQGEEADDEEAVEVPVFSFMKVCNTVSLILQYAYTALSVIVLASALQQRALAEAGMHSHYMSNQGRLLALLAVVCSCYVACFMSISLVGVRILSKAAAAAVVSTATSTRFRMLQLFCQQHSQHSLTYSAMLCVCVIIHCMCVISCLQIRNKPFPWKCPDCNLWDAECFKKCKEEGA